MKPPCEVIVKELLPFIRAFLVKELASQKIKQSKIAEKLALTDAAISQYLKETRGREPKMLKKFDFVIQDLRKTANLITKENITKPEILNSICNICKEIRSSPKFCNYHRGILKLKECDVCR